MRPITRPFPVFLVLLLLAACGGGSSSTTTTPSRAEVQASLDDITASGVTGVLLRLAGPFGSEVLRSGVADRASGRLARATDTFRIASISKAYSGAVILGMVRDGLVGLDDAVADWLPANIVPNAEQITIRQLLDHTSGVFNYTESEVFQRALESDPGRVWTPQQVVAVAAAEGPLFPPGTAYRYSNTDNFLVAMIAEVASGRDYTTLLQERVFDRIDARHTMLPTEIALPAPFIRGYLYDADGTTKDVSEVLSPSGAWASGAIISNVVELGRFIGALVAGDFYGEALRVEARRTVPGDSDPPGPPGPGQNRAGLGQFRYDAACATMWGHTGSFPGYRSYALATDDGRRTLVMTLNEEPVPAPAGPLILAALELAICRLVDR